MNPKKKPGKTRTKAKAKAKAKAKRPAKSVKRVSSPKKSTKAVKVRAKSTKSAKPAKATKTTKATKANRKNPIKAAKSTKGKKTAGKKTATKLPARSKQKGKPKPVAAKNAKIGKAAKPKPAPKRPVSKKTVKTKTDKSTATNKETTSRKARPETKSSLPTTAPKAARLKTTVDEMPLDIEEKEELREEERKDLIKVLREDEDEPLETSFVPTDTSERLILVVDEEGQRRTETISIVSQILPNAVIEVADDPDEALEIMGDLDFDTYVVNFLMPGYSASPFVKAVANHPDHSLLIGFAADKISDALDQRKGLKIIPLKRLFDLEPTPDGSREKGR